MDPQTNCTFYFMDYNSWNQWQASHGTIKNLYESYLGVGNQTPFNLNPMIMKNFYMNPHTGSHQLPDLSLIPAHLEMMGVEADLAYVIGRSSAPRAGGRTGGLKRYYEILNSLKDALSPIKDRNEYDFIFLDCPPSIGLLTQSALVASESFFIPAVPDYLSTIGIQFLQRRVEEMVDRVNKAQTESGIKGRFYGPKRKGIILSRVRVYRWGPPLELVSPQDIVYARLQKDSVLSPLIFKGILSESARVQESAENHIPAGIRSGNTYAQQRSQVEEITEEFLRRV